jgi:2,3-bisphosphoglycerate-dependent phosphoglycerate mutase
VTTRLWLVRHAETDWSSTGRLCGWTDVPLNERGRDQARARAWTLVGRRFTTAWSSDLRRAVETARLSHGSPTTDPRLRELRFGALEGLRWAELAPPTQGALLSFDGFAAPDGEAVESLRRRVLAFIAELPPGDHLLFTHGGVMRLLLRQAGSDQSIDPCGIAVLTAEGLRVV